MRGRCALATTLVAVAAAVTVTAAAAEDGALGGWTEVEVTAETTALLADALTRSGEQYEAVTRVCFQDIVSVKTQVVAGTNYRFVVSGCDVTSDGGVEAAGRCAADMNAPVGGFIVKVWEQQWTDTLRVTDVSPVDLMHVESFAEGYDRDVAEPGYGDDDAVETSLEELDLEELELEELEEQEDDEDAYADGEDEAMPETADLEVSDEEKADIDAWLEDNADTLNEYGDPVGTYYTGGSPLFDETTGELMDKYEYIERRHPNRPWSDDEGETTTDDARLRSNLLSTEEDAARSGGSAFGTFAKVIGLLGLFAGALVVVAVAMVQRRGRVVRRFSYHPINGRSVL